MGDGAFDVSDHNRRTSASIPYPHQSTGFGTRRRRGNPRRLRPAPPQLLGYPRRRWVPQLGLRRLVGELWIRRNRIEVGPPPRNTPWRARQRPLRGTIRSPDTPRDGALWLPPAGSCRHAAGRCRSATERSQSRACCRAHGVWRRRAGSVRPRHDGRGRPTRQPVGHPPRHRDAD